MGCKTRKIFPMLTYKNLQMSKPPNQHVLILLLIETFEACQLPIISMDVYPITRQVCLMLV